MIEHLQTDRLRLAFYGRYSSDNQSDTSIEDQLARCRKWAESFGHLIVCCFEDRAISGSSTLNRDGFQDLMAAAFGPKPAFNGIVVDDLSRLSRDLGDTHRYIKRLQFKGLRVISVVDGIDTTERPAKVQVAVKALLNEVYIDNLREQTKRGLDGNFRRGMSTGGRIYGFSSVPVDPLDREKGFKRVVDDDQAEVVRQIFRRFSAGEGEKRIAKDLNARHVGGKTWGPNVIWNMLRNRSYVGVFTFNRFRWVKNPDTGKRNYRERPKDEWIVTEMPELRVIDDELWTKVCSRIAGRTKATGGPRSGHKKTRLLSGLVHCSCGRRMTLHGVKYSCPDYFEKGICKSSVRFRRDSLEALVIKVLQERLLPFVGELETEVNRRAGASDQLHQMRDMKREISRLEDAIKNRVAFSTKIDLGEFDEYLLEVIEGERQELRELKEGLEALDHENRTIKIDPDLIEAALRCLDEVLKKDVCLAKEFLAGMIDEIVISPVGSGDLAPGHRCPICGKHLKRLSPQHAKCHGMTVDQMMADFPELGVNQPVEIQLVPNIKDLLSEEEVVYMMVAGAGFEPATFGL